MTLLGKTSPHPFTLLALAPQTVIWGAVGGGGGGGAIGLVPTFIAMLSTELSVKSTIWNSEYHKLKEEWLLYSTTHQRGVVPCGLESKNQRDFSNISSY